MSKEKKAWYKRWWAITLWIILGLGFIGSFMDDTNIETQNTQTPTSNYIDTQAEVQKDIVSNSFSDYIIYCDIDATNLQKEDIFNTKFKDKYVEWTGTVSSISDSMGRYSLQVRHCPDTWTSDIIITMRDNQKSNLLKYREDDSITYTAKLTRYGEILGLSANDGVVIE